jgi:hypothetical protein
VREVHVRGIEPEKAVAGAPFWHELLIYTGLHEYTNKRGVKHEIQGFVVYKLVTRDEFAQALAGGFELVRYKIVVKKPAQAAGPEEAEVVAEPVAGPGGPPSVKKPSSSG